jgi:hypothetical protein
VRVYRTKIIASLSVLAAVATFFIVPSVLGPNPAGAQANNVPRFVFGPVLLPSGSLLLVQFWNTAGAGRTTPPGTINIVDPTAGVVESKQFGPVAADQLQSNSYEFADPNGGAE